MSDDSSSSEKTEQPTPKKLRDAREQGQVAQSKELNIFVAIATILALLFFMQQKIVQLLADSYLMSFKLIREDNGQGTLFDVIPSIWHVLTTNLLYSLAIIGVTAFLSFAVNVLQVGGIVFSKEFFKFDLNKFNPVENLKQTFSLKNLVKFLKNLLEISIISTLAYFLLLDILPDLIKLSQLDFANIISLISLDLIKILLWLLGCYLIFALTDWWWEKYNLIKQLKMTKDEIEKEQKETDGDPEIKAKRKELHRELVSDDSMSNTVKDSTFVLANPTHIAIVILFSPRRWPLPLILMKATDDYAQKIFALANKHKILIVREKFVARQLYELGEIGKFIPKSMLPDIGNIIKKNLRSLPTVVKELEIKQKAGKVNKV